jgi:hypothetical protein
MGEIIVQGVQYLRKCVSLHDLKNVEVNFWDQIEKEFENQLNHYGWACWHDIFWFLDLHLCLVKANEMLSNLISIASHFMYL